MTKKSSKPTNAASHAAKKQDKPAYVTALKAAYGAPSQAGFGSAVFYTDKDAKDLTKAARKYYQHFVGELWERWGEDAWMGPWKEVYARTAGAKAEIVAELKDIDDFDARNSVPRILEVVQNADAAQKALSAAYDDPTVTELRVLTLGDGEALAVRPWARTADYGQVHSEMLEQMKVRFGDAGISMPYPTQDVYLHQAT